MDYRGIQKLKAFFSALKDSGFKQDLKQIPSFAMVDGQRTPVDKAYCLSLLRSFPQFQGDKFKDDNAIIKYLSDPINRKFLLGNFTQEQQIELTKALEEKPVVVEAVSEQPGGQEGVAAQQAPVGEPTATMTGGISFPGMATGTAVATPRRVIRVVPRAEKVEEPTSKLYVADKSGRVVEERTITPTSVTTKKPEAPSKIYIADKSGNVVDERSLTGETIKSPAQPKLYVANKSGVVVEERIIPRASRFKFPAQIKNFGSKLGVFFQRNIGKYLTVGRIGTAVSTVIGGIAGSAFGGAGTFAGAIGGGVLPSFIKSGGAGKFLGRVGNGAINAGVGISNQVSRGGLSLVGPKKRVWLGALGLFMFMFGAGLLASLIPGGQQPQIPPTGGGGNIASCKFTREGASSPIKSTILQGWIISAANAAGISPAVLASVARHESPEFVTNADNNHDAIKTNNYCNPGKKFCEKNGQVLHSIIRQDDPCTSDEIANGAKTAQALGLMQALDIYNPGKDLCKITESLAIAASKLKGDGITAQPTQDQINTAIRRYYNSCTYDSYSYCDEVWKDYQNCQQVTPPTGGAVASCPVVGGKITNSSFTKNPAGGHCSSGYQKQFTCTQCPGGPTASRRADAIDVETGGPNGKDVVLPTIQGQIVQWTMLPPICAGAGEYPNCTNANGGTGALLNFKAPLPGIQDTWYIQFVHMALDKIYLQPGSTNPSGTAVGKTDTTAHVHTTIGKDIADPNAACDPGWMPSDFMCDGSIPAVIAVDPISIGDGSRGTPITGYKIESGPIGTAIIGSIHGKWEDAARQLVETAKDALGNKSINLPNNLTVYLIPIINVDPKTTNTSDGRAAFNADSVDLNRNFDSRTVPGGGWNSLTCSMPSGRYASFPDSFLASCGDVAGTTDVSDKFPEFCSQKSSKQFRCAEGYSGSGPLSAAESQVLANFLKSNNIKVVLSYHAPLSDVTISNGGQRVDGAEELGRAMAGWTDLRYDNFFTNYPLTGQLMDWLQDQGIIGVEVELRSAQGLPDKDQQLRAIEQALNWSSNKFK